MMVKILITILDFKIKAIDIEMKNYNSILNNGKNYFENSY
jgi:hypothetical protein